MINQVGDMSKYLISLLFGLAAAAQPGVRIQSDSVPHASLRIEVTVPAALDAVWEAFTTSQGLSTWLTPGAIVDLREGGEWTAHYPGGKTGGETIRAFTAKRELIVSALAPEQFPTVRAERTTVTFQFVPVDSRTTLVRLVQTGWKQSAEWDRAYDYLAQGNAQLLEMLRRRFLNGPIDWAKEWGVSQ
jgi:uncharacterized protein YndB with AHSA1/START domain